MALVAAPKPAAPYRRPSRLARARQATVSLAVVLGCYWLYWFLAVPMVEPVVEGRIATRATEEQIEAARGDVTVRQREVAQFFNEGDWERQSPAIWQRGQIRLLFKELQPQPDGTVLLKPCTLMLFPKPRANQPQRPIIMRTTEGAQVRFDQKIVFKTVDLQQRKFVGGMLAGPIRIYQRESAPGAGDDLEITTRDIEMSSDRAWTAHPVRFRLGRSHGSGRDLEIRLAGREGEAEANVMRGASLDSLELKRDVRMRLEMGSGPLAAAPDAAPRKPRPDDAPIEITCRGKLRFDMADYAVSFHDHVDVFRLNPDRESDQLNCELLTVYFARPGELPTPPPGAPVGPASQVRLIEARGNPVTMRSAVQGIYARCSGADFLPGPPGSPGQLIAFGPGVIRGDLPDGTPGTYVAQWARELRFEPEGALQKVTLRGATVIEFGALGTITADEVFAWLSRKPAPPGAAPADPGAQGDWELERVLAQRYPDPQAISQGDVKIAGPQMHAVAATLEAVVQRGTPAGAGPAAADPRAAPDRRQPKNPRERLAPSERFDVAGRAVRIGLVPQGENLAVASATIDGAARLEQFALQPGAPGAAAARTLLVKGDRLHVADAHNEATRVTINGQPGFVEASGMSLWGQSIELEKRTSRLWIDGSGRLALPLTQDLDGKPLERPQTLTVDWKRRMDFQSDTAVFQGTVVARSAQQVVHTDKLEAALTRGVDFANPRAQGQQPDLAAVRTYGPSMLEGRQFDEQGQQQSYSTMQVADLSIHRGTGEISAVGPGTVMHITLGSPAQLAPPGAAGQAPAAAQAPSEPDKDQLTYLHVRFRRGIRGNLNRREVTFFDDTKTLYGPIKDWNDRLQGASPAELGPEGMLLDADELTVREMTGRTGSKRGWFELEAAGSVYAEGQGYTAEGERLTYAEQNELLVLHGSPAVMYMQDDRTGQRQESRADLVKYWFREGRGEVNGARFFNLAVPGGVRRGDNKTKKTGSQTPAAPAAATVPPR